MFFSDTIKKRNKKTSPTAWRGLIWYIIDLYTINNGGKSQVKVNYFLR